MIENNIKKIRESKKLNKRQMAQILDLPYTTYNNYEIGTRDPSSDVLIKLSETFEVTVDFILGRESNSTYLDDQQYIERYKSLDEISKKTINNAIDFEFEQTNKRIEEHKNDMTLTEEEQNYINKIRELNKIDKERVFDYIEDVYDLKDMEDEYDEMKDAN